MMDRRPPTRHRAMAKPNPLQAQLLKAGLVNKAKVAEAAREQHKARHGKGPAKPSESALAAERARADRIERDRALARERKSQARLAELRRKPGRSSKTSRCRALATATTASTPTSPSAASWSVTRNASSWRPARW